jgi:putative salt-induced outer membrane protein
MHKLVLPCLCVGLSMAASASAQTTSKPDGQWRGSLSAGVSQATGNNESLTAAVNTDVVRQTQSDKITAYLQDLYARRETAGVRELAASLFRTGGRYDRDFSDLSYGFAGFDVEKNKLADLRWRYSPSVGAGLHIRRTERFNFDVFGGYSYNREELYSGPTRSFNEALLGEETTNNFSEDASFHQRLAVYPNLTDSGEYRVVFDAGLTAPLVDRLSLKLNYSVHYQSNPPAGVQKRDTLLYTGLQYTWGPK